MEPKTMKKPSKKRHVFQGPQKSSPDVIFRGTLRRSRSKSVIFDGFWAPAGLQNDPSEHHFRPKRLHKSKVFRTGRVLEPT